MSSDNIKVAVRVRPFNQREKDRNSKLIVSMNGPTTILMDPTGAERKFTFDYSYFSNDPSDPKFADQKVVFNDLGNLYLENAWKGYNASIFAYGQTGSGKSYSMMGTPDQKGIIPLGCEEMFRRIDDNKVANLQYKVEVSYLEIYNEAIHDLLNPKNNPTGGLKLRDAPTTGPYVVDLSKAVVKSYKQIADLMDEGNKVRAVGATAMNATSSRSHSVFTIYLTQLTTMEGKVGEKASRISLVDLAGSERADSTGATGDRLKEGCAINQSLSALGNVISALADNASASKKVYVPYRDSKLTHLLKESLGGNARTIMIAALSPADINFEETLSTLRYADRAKNIRTNAVVNEDPTAKMIRELQEEVARLKAQLAAGGGGGAAAAAGAVAGGAVANPASDAELERMRNELAENEKMMSSLKETWEDKEKKSEAIREARLSSLKDMGLSVAEIGSMFDVDTNTPYLQNLSDDPACDGVLVYYVKSGVTKFGRADANDVVLNGIGVQDAHFTVENTSSGKDKKAVAQVYLTPCAASASGSTKAASVPRVTLNGMLVNERTLLLNRSRLVIGRSLAFRVVIPGAPVAAGSDAASAAELAEQANGLDALIEEANEMSEEIGRQVVYAQDYRQIDVAGSAEDRTEIVVRVSNLASGEVDIWSVNKFRGRVEQMRDFYALQKRQQQQEQQPQQSGVSAAPAQKVLDPFVDRTEDEVRDTVITNEVRPLQKDLESSHALIKAQTAEIADLRKSVADSQARTTDLQNRLKVAETAAVEAATKNADAAAAEAVKLRQDLAAAKAAAEEGKRAAERAAELDKAVAALQQRVRDQQADAERIRVQAAEAATRAAEAAQADAVAAVRRDLDQEHRVSESLRANVVRLEGRVNELVQRNKVLEEQAHPGHIVNAAVASASAPAGAASVPGSPAALAAANPQVANAELVRLRMDRDRLAAEVDRLHHDNRLLEDKVTVLTVQIATASTNQATASAVMATSAGVGPMGGVSGPSSGATASSKKPAAGSKAPAHAAAGHGDADSDVSSDSDASDHELTGDAALAHLRHRVEKLKKKSEKRKDRIHHLKKDLKERDSQIKNLMKSSKTNTADAKSSKCGCM